MAETTKRAVLHLNIEQDDGHHWTITSADVPGLVLGAQGVEDLAGELADVPKVAGELAYLNATSDALADALLTPKEKADLEPVRARSEEDRRALLRDLRDDGENLVRELGEALERAHADGEGVPAGLARRAHAMLVHKGLPSTYEQLHRDDAEDPDGNGT